MEHTPSVPCDFNAAVLRFEYRSASNAIRRASSEVDFPALFGPTRIFLAWADIVNRGNDL